MTFVPVLFATAVSNSVLVSSVSASVAIAVESVEFVDDSGCVISKVTVQVTSRRWRLDDSGWSTCRSLLSLVRRRPEVEMAKFLSTLRGTPRALATVDSKADS